MSVPGRARAPEESSDENGPCASPAEKLAALYALTDEDRGRLLRFAEIAARKSYSDGEDLLHEAIARVLDPNNIRKWYPLKVDFLTFLRGCIRSIADDWFKRSLDTEPPDTLSSPFQHDAQTEAAILIDRIRELLSRRPHAVQILDLWMDGCSAQESQKMLGISNPVFLAAMKWIYRTLKQEGFRR